jgi:hypothetical protein
MGWVFEPCFTGVNHLHQLLDGNNTIKQSFLGVHGQYNRQIETSAEHGVNVARRHFFSDEVAALHEHADRKLTIGDAAGYSRKNRGRAAELGDWRHGWLTRWIAKPANWG